MYTGTKFTRDQLEFVVRTMLVGGLDQIESSLDDCTQELVNSLMGTSLAATGMSLSVLAYQLTGEGQGVDDALACAGDFCGKCEVFIKAYYEKHKILAEALHSINALPIVIKEVYEKIIPGFYPDPKTHAKIFVDTLFKDYLGEVIEPTDEQKLAAYKLGMDEFMSDSTTHFGPELIEYYDQGRDKAHELTNRKFDG